MILKWSFGWLSFSFHIPIPDTQKLVFDPQVSLLLLFILVRNHHPHDASASTPAHSR